MKYLFTSTILLFSILLTAQYNYGLEVEQQDAKIEGKLNIESARNTTFVGEDAGIANTQGFASVAFGGSAYKDNTTGYYNTAIGTESMRFNQTGIQNTAVGQGSLNRNVSGLNNTAVGSSALSLTQGNHNTAVGRIALSSNITGNYNTAIGSAAFASLTNLENSTALGYQAQPLASNQVRIGNANVTEIGGFVNWSNVSDARFKNNIESNVPGLDFITLLEPVTYQLDMTTVARHYNIPENHRKKSSENLKGAIRYSGFLAQDVHNSATHIGYEFSGVDKPDSETDIYSIRYADFVVPLVKAVQELNEQNQALKNENEDLQNRLQKLERIVSQLK